jgi:hypothetical protein
MDFRRGSEMIGLVPSDAGDAEDEDDDDDEEEEEEEEEEKGAVAGSAKPAGIGLFINSFVSLAFDANSFINLSASLEI